MRKRKTIEDDIDRLEERIWRRGRGKIRNQADFIGVYDSYLKDSSAGLDQKLRNKVFSRMRQKHKGISAKVKINAERMELFELAGTIPSKKEFDIIGSQKGRKVYARRTKFKFKDKERTVFRDSKGRFVKAQR